MRFRALNLLTAKDTTGKKNNSATTIGSVPVASDVKTAGSTP